MLMVDLIAKKRYGGELTPEELDFIVSGYTSGEIPDYQVSALLMAICFVGMTEPETAALTISMLNSGTQLDLSSVPGIHADKHSTGGVGDKTSIALIPLMASAGVQMAKMAGRGLGHTGGTIDKLSSIPGLSTALPHERFIDILGRIGCVIAEQTLELTPADKKMYALRDVTGTVESVPLIVSSVMSKKLAAGADVIVLDVKAGSGSFMSTDEEAISMAREMVQVGYRAGRRVSALVTDMDEPLGFAVGNALEVIEAISVLRGESAGNLRELCLRLGTAILRESGTCSDDDEARAKLCELIDSGAALDKLAQLVNELGGDTRYIYDTELFPPAPYIRELRSDKSGYVSAIAADEVGRVSLRLGGGRARLGDAIDPRVGVLLRRKRGDAIAEGNVLAEIHAASEESARDALEQLRLCYTISPAPPEPREFIKAEILSDK